MKVGTRAYRCAICDGDPRWRLDRTGDATVSWACDSHLPAVCDQMQRAFEVTQITVRRSGPSTVKEVVQ